ncbi:hypothetical protein HK405_006346, partial [Cladochytrium tenue]
MGVVSAQVRKAFAEAASSDMIEPFFSSDLSAFFQAGTRRTSDARQDVIRSSLALVGFLCEVGHPAALMFKASASEFASAAVPDTLASAAASDDCLLEAALDTDGVLSKLSVSGLDEDGAAALARFVECCNSFGRLVHQFAREVSAVAGARHGRPTGGVKGEKLTHWTIRQFSELLPEPTVVQALREASERQALTLAGVVEAIVEAKAAPDRQRFSQAEADSSNMDARANAAYRARPAPSAAPQPEAEDSQSQPLSIKMRLRSSVRGAAAAAAAPAKGASATASMMVYLGGSSDDGSDGSDGSSAASMQVDLPAISAASPPSRNAAGLSIIKDTATHAAVARAETGRPSVDTASSTPAIISNTDVSAVTAMTVRNVAARVATPTAARPSASLGCLAVTTTADNTATTEAAAELRPVPTALGSATDS